MKTNLKTQRGITLVALVVTIIILLILAAITINLAIGQNGIITTAKQSGKNYQESTNTEQNTLTDFWSKAEEVIGATVGKIYEIPTITVENKDEWAKQKEVTISMLDGYTTRYTTDGSEPGVNNGIEYLEPITITENCTIKAMYINNKNIGNSVTEQVTKIDGNDPTKLDITVTAGKSYIKVDVTAAEDDEGGSGIAGYRFSKDNGTTWTDYQTETTYTFSNIYGDLTGVTCNILVETKDLAGNVKQATKSAKTTCYNNTYYKTGAFTLATVTGRGWYKTNSEGAICCLYWQNGYMGPMIVSDSYNGVLSRCDVESTSDRHTIDTLTYGGATYYYATTVHGMNVSSYSSSLVLINSSSSQYTSTYQAAIALLNKYYQ